MTLEPPARFGFAALDGLILRLPDPVRMPRVCPPALEWSRRALVSSGVGPARSARPLRAPAHRSAGSSRSSRSPTGLIPGLGTDEYSSRH